MSCNIYDDGIPAALLTLEPGEYDDDFIAKAIGEARKGDRRLILVDEDVGLFLKWSDPDLDLHIDADRGNWDIFADNYYDTHFDRLSSIMIRRDGLTEEHWRVAKVHLAAILAETGAEPGADLMALRRAVHRVTHDHLAAMYASAGRDDLDASAAWVILAALQEAAGRFAARDPDLPLVSVLRWLKGDPRSILFITAHAPVPAACPTVRGAMYAFEI